MTVAVATTLLAAVLWVAGTFLIAAIVALDARQVRREQDRVRRARRGRRWT